MMLRLMLLRVRGYSYTNRIEWEDRACASDCSISKPGNAFGYTLSIAIDIIYKYMNILMFTGIICVFFMFLAGYHDCPGTTF